MGSFPPLARERRHPWQICEIGGSMAAGFQLYQHNIEAVTGTYLHVLGFDPARVISDTADVAPFLAKARKQALRRMLVKLHDYMRAVLGDSDTYAQTSTETMPELTGDMWELVAGVTAAIGLYRHGARTMSVHVLFYIWEGLGIGNPRTTAPSPQSHQTPPCGTPPSTDKTRLSPGRPVTGNLLTTLTENE